MVESSGSKSISSSGVRPLRRSGSIALSGTEAVGMYRCGQRRRKTPGGIGDPHAMMLLVWSSAAQEKQYLDSVRLTKRLESRAAPGPFDMLAAIIGAWRAEQCSFQTRASAGFEVEASCAVGSCPTPTSVLHFVDEQDDRTYSSRHSPRNTLSRSSNRRGIWHRAS